jgi:DNA-binding NarL/FixJ family response regulator
VERSPDLELVGEAATGAEAVALAREHRPNVVVMDLRMPEMSGIEATRRIAELAAPPETRVLVLTMSEDDDALFAAMRVGARGYFRKDGESGDLVHAIRSVAAGDVIFGESIAARVLVFFAGPRMPRPDPSPGLTYREAEVLDLVAGGRSNAQIANRLGISEKTVRNHIASVFNKLQTSHPGDLPDDGGAGSPVRTNPSPDAGAGSAALPEPHEPDSEA